MEFDISNNGFEFQNKLLAAASGIDDDVWTILAGGNLQIEGLDATITSQNGKGYCAYTADLKNSTVVYTYHVDVDGFLCVSLNLPKRNDVAIWVNGEQRYSEAISLPQMLAVGDVREGDVVELKMTCKIAGESSTMTISAAVLDQASFAAHYDVLNASTLRLTEFSNTEVVGTIRCDREGLLYTSIPQNGNWYAEVDGKEVQTLTVGDAMTAVALTEGSHEVRFYYHNRAFSLGWKISFVCFAVFGLLVWNSFRGDDKKGKYERMKKERR